MQYYEINAEHVERIKSITREVDFTTIMNVKNGKVMNHFEKERNIDNMMNCIIQYT